MSEKGTCYYCDKPLEPGEDWPEDYQRDGRRIHVSCNQKEARGTAKVRRLIEVGEDLSRSEYSALSTAEQRALRAQYKGFWAFICTNGLGTFRWGDLEPEVWGLIGTDAARRLSGFSFETRGQRRKKTSGPSPKPRQRRKVSVPTLGVSRPRWRYQDEAMMSSIRHNKMIDHDGCQLTGDIHAASQSCHILSRELCYKMGHPEWAADEENNVVYLSTLANDLMYRGQHYISFAGFLKVVPGYERSIVLEKAGAYDTQIEMTERMRFYALIAMKELGV